MLRSITVRIGDITVEKINELEWVDGLIYANIWKSQWLIMINPNNGQVVGKVLLKDLLPEDQRTAKTDVLNGIAYDNDKKTFVGDGEILAGTISYHAICKTLNR